MHIIKRMLIRANCNTQTKCISVRFLTCVPIVQAASTAAKLADFKTFQDSTFYMRMHFENWSHNEYMFKLTTKATVITWAIV